MKDIELIELFAETFQYWSGFEEDPWLRVKTEFPLRSGVTFPNVPGIYMFKSSNFGSYYIGSASSKIMLQGRLAGKLTADIRESRCVNFRDEKGLLHHWYSYLPIYEEESTTLFYLKSNSQISHLDAEGIMHAAYFEKYKIMPQGHLNRGKLRHNPPRFAKTNDTKASGLLLNISEQFGLQEPKKILIRNGVYNG